VQILNEALGLDLNFFPITIYDLRGAVWKDGAGMSQGSLWPGQVIGRSLMPSSFN